MLSCSKAGDGVAAQLVLVVLGQEALEVDEKLRLGDLLVAVLVHRQKGLREEGMVGTNGVCASLFLSLVLSFSLCLRERHPNLADFTLDGGRGHARSEPERIALVAGEDVVLVLVCRIEALQKLLVPHRAPVHFLNVAAKRVSEKKKERKKERRRKEEEEEEEEQEQEQQ